MAHGKTSGARFWKSGVSDRAGESVGFGSASRGCGRGGVSDRARESVGSGIANRGSGSGNADQWRARISSGRRSWRDDKRGGARGERPA